MSTFPVRFVVVCRSLVRLAVVSGALSLFACCESAPPPDAAAEASPPDSAAPAPPATSPAGAPAPSPGSASGGPGHRLDDLSGVEIPATPAAGTAHGIAFTVEKATFENGILELRQGSGFFADRSFMIFTFLMEEAPDGRSFAVKPDSGFGSPHIHVSYLLEDDGVPESEIFTDDYAMRLEFGTVTDGRLPGSIYLCIPDEAKSFVVGTFEAEVK